MFDFWLIYAVFLCFFKNREKFLYFFSFLFPFTALLFAPYTLILCRQFLKVSCPFPFQAKFFSVSTTAKFLLALKAQKDLRLTAEVFLGISDSQST